MAIFKGIKMSSTNAREFLFFLLLTTLVATLIKLSKSYTTSYNVSVQIVDLPIDKAIRSVSQENVEVRITSTGFALLRNRVGSPELKIPYDELSRTSQGTYFYEMNENFASIRTSLEGDTEVLSVKPKQLSVVIDSTSSKLVPVAPNVEISYAAGYLPKGDLKIVPDSILVVGPSRLLDKMNAIQTDTLRSNDTQETIKEILEIRKRKGADSKYLTYEIQKVEVIQEVTQFIETSITVPVKIINKTDAIIKILPKTVEITYKVDIMDVDAIEPSDFVITCTYNSKAIQSEYLPIVVAQKPEQATSVELVEERVKFIVVH